MKKNLTLWWIVGIVIILGGLLWWGGSATKTPSEGGDTISTNGIHWHPELTIYVDGEKEDIPANVGLVGGHQPMHTHVEDAPQGVLHFEFEGAVRNNDLRLKNFFRIWGNKDVMTAFGTLDRMTVNGEEITEYGDYAVQSEDTIELHYTTSTQSGIQGSGYQTLSVQELNDSLTNKDFTLVNVHTPYTAEIAGTDAFIPYDDIAQSLSLLPADKNAKIVLYCQSGNMSATAAQTLVNLGYTNVTDVPGGMIEWEKRGYSLSKSQ